MITRRGFLKGLLAGAAVATGALAMPAPKPRPRPAPPPVVEEDFVRITVPMCFYSHTRRITLATSLVS